MFKIIGGDGKVYGPVTEDQIRQWISEGRANGETQVLSEGDQQWKPLSAFAQFGFTASAPAEAAPPALATRPARPSGIIKVFGVLNIIFGSFGLLCTPVSIVMLPQTLQRLGANSAMKTWLSFSAVLSLAGAAIVLASGIGLVKYRAWARRLAVYYSVFACAMSVVNAAMVLGPLSSSLSASGPERTVSVIAGVMSGILGLTYNVLLIAFLTRRSAREAVGEVAPETS